MNTEADAERVWTHCAQAIRDQVSDAVWRTTFSGARAAALDQRSLLLVVPTNLQKARIERRFLTLLTDAVDETAPDISVRIEVDADRPISLASTDADASVLTAASTDDRSDDRLGAAKACSTGSSESKNLSRYTFDHFVTGSSNRFPHAAALAVAEAPAGAYNPLFIHGDSGLGKTHLLRAISHYVNQHYAAYKVRYVTCETFLNDFVQAIRDRTQPEFKQNYRNNDVLLVDDIQFIEGKDGLQSEFFHTFNDLLQNGAQIVMSSDRAPDAMPTLEDRLRSRFKSGLITDIQRPDLVTRLAILEKKAQSSRLEIPSEVFAFIAENITDSVRELEGALIKVTAYANISGQRCSFDLARQVLHDLASKPAKEPVTCNRVMSAAAELFGFTVDQIISANRRRPLVEARQMAMYVTRNATDLSYPEIGRAFGNRDHTTVIHAVRKIEGQMAQRKEVYEQVHRLQDRVHGEP